MGWGYVKTIWVFLKLPADDPRQQRTGDNDRGYTVKSLCRSFRGKGNKRKRGNMNNFYFDLHKDIVTRQGKTCKKCKRSLALADKIHTIDGAMYCGKCGDLKSRKATLKREIERTI